MESLVLRSSASSEHSASVAETRTAWWNHYVITATLALRFGRAQYYTIDVAGFYLGVCVLLIRVYDFVYVD